MVQAKTPPHRGAGKMCATRLTLTAISALRRNKMPQTGQRQRCWSNASGTCSSVPPHRSQVCLEPPSAAGGAVSSVGVRASTVAVGLSIGCGFVSRRGFATPRIQARMFMLGTPFNLDNLLFHFDRQRATGQNAQKSGRARQKERIARVAFAGRLALLGRYRGPRCF